MYNIKSLFKYSYILFRLHVFTYKLILFTIKPQHISLFLCSQQAATTIVFVEPCAI